MMVGIVFVLPLYPPPPLCRCQFPITIGEWKAFLSFHECVCVYVHKCFCVVRKGEWNRQEGGDRDSLLVLNHLWRRVMWVAAGPCSDRPPACLELCVFQTAIAFCLVTYVTSVDNYYICKQRLPQPLLHSLPQEGLQFSLELCFSVLWIISLLETLALLVWIYFMFDRITRKTYSAFS
jgi:hypothetical protein